MTHRNRTILRILSESTSGYTTVEKIATETGAGIRTIHRDLEGLERSLRLRGVRLERRRGYGIRLIDPLPESLLDGIRETLPLGGSESGQRPMMVLLYLIIVADWAKLAEIASILYVSDSTISNDLTILESWLPEGLVLQRYKGTGTRLVSDEFQLRLLFLSSFPAIFPMYVINRDTISTKVAASGEERFIESLGVKSNRTSIIRKITVAEEVLGYRFSSMSRGLLYAYLYLLFQHLPQGIHLDTLPNFRLEVPEPFSEAAIAMIASDIAGNTDSPEVTAAEIELLARVLSSCETTGPPTTSVAEIMGSLSTRVETMLENSLSRLEEKEKIWLHDDRIFLNYFRMTVVAAARRIDLGLSKWWDLGLRPIQDIEETPVSVVLVSQFMSDFGRILREPSPAIVRREIQEVSLAVGARLEAFHSRSSSPLKIRILCYEGLGMSNYLLALARDIFPAGTVFNSLWDPEYEKKLVPGQYHLVITTIPLAFPGIPVLFLKGDDHPDQIRQSLRETARELSLTTGSAGSTAAAAPADRDPEEPPKEIDATVYSLAEVMAVIEGFFVLQKSNGEDSIALAVRALEAKGGEAELLRRDFERRESYGSLIFEDMNLRILHCRTEGVTEPCAGVIQDSENGETVLILAAPISAKQSQTHALSEIVIALNEYDDFPKVLAKGGRREIQARLMTLFGHKAI